MGVRIPATPESEKGVLRALPTLSFFAFLPADRWFSFLISAICFSTYTFLCLPLPCDKGATHLSPVIGWDEGRFGRAELQCSADLACTQRREHLTGSLPASSYSSFSSPVKALEQPHPRD